MRICVFILQLRGDNNVLHANKVGKWIMLAVMVLASINSAVRNAELVIFYVV